MILPSLHSFIMYALYVPANVGVIKEYVEFIDNW